MPKSLFRPIQLPSAADYDRLGGCLSEIVTQYESDHARMLHDYRVYTKWYEAEPITKERTFPFRGASNLVVPLIRTACDSATARLFAMVQARRRTLWTGYSENEDFADHYLQDILKFLNWAARREFDTFWSILDWITEATILGSSVLTLSWEERDRYLLLPNSRKPSKVNLRRGPKLQHWTAEKVLWDSGVPIRETEVCLFQSLYSWSELVRRQQLEGYRPEAVEATRSHPITDGTPSLEVQYERERLAGVDISSRLTHRRLYDRRLAYLDWPVLQGMKGSTHIEPERFAFANEDDDERVRVPILVEFCPKSQQVFKIIHYPYLSSDGLNAFDLHFTRRAGYPRGIGLAKKLEGLQAGMTMMVNQAVDAVTLGNSTILKTTDAALRQRPITPGQVVLVNSMDSLEPVGTPKAIMPDIAMINLLEVFAERAGAATDPLVGRESRSGGHPSPATNYLGMLEQSTTMVSPIVKMMREQLSKVGEFAATLYQQFDTDPEGRLVRHFGNEAGDRISTFLFPTDDAIPGNVDFDLTALSETENPQSQIQQSLLISQVTQNYFATLFKALEIMKNPQMGQDPDVRQLVTKTIETLGRTHQHFLEAAEFDEAQDVIYRLQEQGANNAEALNRFAALLGRVGAGQPGASDTGGAEQPQGAAGGSEGAAGFPPISPVAPPGRGVGGPLAVGFA